jgi:hypothetical protein
MPVAGHATGQIRSLSNEGEKQVKKFLLQLEKGL